MGQYSKFPKLQVEDLGTEDTGDKIALFDSDGKVVGYIQKTDIYTKEQAIETFVGRYNVQNIDAEKTFIVSPIVPTPTLGGHAVNKDYADALSDTSTKLVRNTESYQNQVGETQAFISTIDANTIGENDVINGTFIFNCLVATTKVDYKVVIGGIEVAFFSQVGYQAINESTNILVKSFRDGTKLKVNSTLIGGTAVVYSFYYESTLFDFSDDNDFIVTMSADNANEVSVQFSELILSK